MAARKKGDLVLYSGDLFPTEARKPPSCPLVKPKMGGYHVDIGQKTIQKAKAHPAERDRQRGMLSFFLEKGEMGNLSS